MSTDRLIAAVEALVHLPEGPVSGASGARRFIATKTTFAGGRSAKLFAEELGGTDTISLNLYNLVTGPRLYPCEMTEDKVIDFLLTFTPDNI
jgi:hypothetical protein